MGRDSYVTRMKKEIKSAAFFRDVAAEILGTFLLVSVQIAVVMDPNTGINLDLKVTIKCTFIKRVPR